MSEATTSADLSQTATTLQDKDNITLFQSYGRMTDDHSEDWMIRVTGWLYRTAGMGMRSQFLLNLSQRLISPSSLDCEASTSLFCDRTSPFFAQPLRNTPVCLVVLGIAKPSVGTSSTVLNPPDELMTDEDIMTLDEKALQEHTGTYIGEEIVTDSSGRFCCLMRVPKSAVDRMMAAQLESNPSIQRQPWTRLLLMAYLPNRCLKIRDMAVITLIPSTGITVISDIDDTIKDSSVFLGKRLAAKVAFLEDGKEVRGMSDCYNLLSAKGVAIHYLSAGPFQLYSPISAFLKTFSFPQGSVTLRNVREVLSTRAYKNTELVRILKDFPNHKFILIGDSGEKDIDIYYEIDKTQSEKIIKMFIRNVTEDASKIPDLLKRVDNLYGHQHDRKRWTFFNNSVEIITDEVTMDAIMKLRSTCT
ncbi:hypothetical protein BATDEDRAFT_35509 [Batrachochytrium dendrobatidis JAM81]|uniref:Phosphatidate phosphatase APP1 catalytic domain-containing protein n=1 Tax=Batrachochytrium dendrobatidis (strain JAM81 / FGSC 10211) TaxID=684364 RepID=F4P776_BATDJ|nr:uncharacterized protein BATDEDRAFT_35509 [Batrachochytrium dendrobatidis JAM81]EGF79034.1 hypothetical protein BATDEDRAFT_35509 [Batrachochytrium dendrobatidis JAM81]|eukprot:XP_006680399.1 hypothetical protein BATDEDRAFT_35509 [Batrachochytrium dendrobatidis JAM81]